MERAAAGRDRTTGRFIADSGVSWTITGATGGCFEDALEDNDILPQAVLLGMTFPLMSGAVIRRALADAAPGTLRRVAASISMASVPRPEQATITTRGAAASCA